MILLELEGTSVIEGEEGLRVYNCANYIRGRRKEVLRNKWNLLGARKNAKTEDYERVVAVVGSVTLEGDQAKGEKLSAAAALGAATWPAAAAISFQPIFEEFEKRKGLVLVNLKPPWPVVAISFNLYFKNFEKKRAARRQVVSSSEALHSPWYGGFGG